MAAHSDDRRQRRGCDQVQTILPHGGPSRTLCRFLRVGGCGAQPREENWRFRRRFEPFFKRLSTFRTPIRKLSTRRVEWEGQASTACYTTAPKKEETHHMSAYLEHTTHTQSGHITVRARGREGGQQARSRGAEGAAAARAAVAPEGGSSRAAARGQVDRGLRAGIVVEGFVVASVDGGGAVCSSCGRRRR